MTVVLSQITFDYSTTTMLTIYSAMYYYDPRTLIHRTIAAETIEPGQEITIPCKCKAWLLSLIELTISR